MLNIDDNQELSTMYQPIVNDVKDIIENGRNSAYSSINSIMIMTYWNIGRRIVEEEQQGQGRAQYGKKLIKFLSAQLQEEYGSGFSERYLAYFRKFFLTIPNPEILQTRLQNLSWSHILTTLRVSDDTARRWYLESASAQGWSVKQLNRNISTQYYERHFSVPQLTDSDVKPNKYEILKTPVMAEFLGFKPDDGYSESDLEASIISHLQDFLLELGKGFAFVARQQHIRTDADDYYIDLVFYNVVLKCYVLIDLKIGKVTHQDVGQMDMYVRMYDEMKLTEGDNPTLGIVLCSETDADIAKYSILKGNEQIFATKYKLNLPTEEQLRREIERQKELFYLQHPSLEEQKEEPQE
ncbi:MAG: PDDEXK nuclease domain-containing protein [Oscillospiraceae bacterium]|nr:PDDEXK nuclease domain-containing protein [Oscillospiraceae bacterium]